MRKYVDQINRLKGLGPGTPTQQYAVKNLNALVGRRKNGPAIILTTSHTREQEQELQEKTADRFKDHERATMVKNVNLAWYRSQATFQIDAREGATWCKCGKDAYLIGGINNGLINHLLIYDITYEKFTDYKVKLDPAIPRFNHTSVVYKKKVWIFGGEKYDKVTRERYPLNDVKVFDPADMAFSWVSSIGEYIPARRNHAACVIGKWMLVHGGVNSEEVMLGDLWLFNLESCKWQSMETDGKAKFLSNHTMTGIFNMNLDLVGKISFWVKNFKRFLGSRTRTRHRSRPL
jgi:hypothetical protein